MLGRRRSDPARLPTVPFEHCPAKTFIAPTGETREGRSVFNHCQIVGAVARELISRFPSSLQASLFPPGADFCAATHDIGKVSPYFFEKIRRACTGGTSLQRLPIVEPELERKWGGHAGVSQVTAVAMHAPELVPEILGQHHGYSPPVLGLRAQDENFGGASWQHERERLVSALREALGSDWPHIATVSKARLLAGLTSVADWIGSGEFFEEPEAPWRENIGAALDAAGFIPPEYRPGLSFRDVFGFDSRPTQQLLIEQASTPGVYVLEAPMGLGKTEAALYAAYRMLGQGQASGIYFALPTRLTSNKIYERFNAFLQRILADECRHRSLLLHSGAWLLEETDLGEEGRPGGSWFNHAKRGLLAPFAVGTVDQALMAAMNVKHGFVRAFGLAGKVVILDEIHTYDAYTGALLDALIALLRELHCTVIVLSATLSQERRQQLLGASVTSNAYPLITSLPQGGQIQEHAVPAIDNGTTTIRQLTADSAAVDEAIERAAAGQQVLWIENTVADAQQRYLDLAARAHELGLACGLLHSRFTADDRQRIEDSWVAQFGKPGWPRRHEHGRILVGTQVLEQSLDIDADFLVTRFAPTDMLLQRLGRLWRHTETPRAAGARREAWLLAPPIAQAIEAPHSAFGASASVYSAYVLCRSLEAWQELHSLDLPADIRPMIERTYVERTETEHMARWLHELDHGTHRRSGRIALRQMARVALSELGTTLSEAKAETRYSEADSHEVLLLRAIELLPERKVTRLTLLSGEELLLPWGRHRASKRGWRLLSAKLARQIVAVRVQDAPSQLPIELLQRFGLHHCFYLGNPEQDEALLRIALVDESAHLQGPHGATAHERHVLSYRDDIGYRVFKN